MKKVIQKARPNWKEELEKVGFSFHSIDGKYWVEDYAYELSLKQIDEIEDATNELHQMCINVAGDIIKSGDYQNFSLPHYVIEKIEKSWYQKEFSLYGRFDLSYDGINPPKMLEYNADTPTLLIESSVAQYNWIEQVKPGFDQFNSIHEHLIQRWQEWAKDKPLNTCLYFASMENTEEDLVNLQYMQDTAIQANIMTSFLYLSEIGYDNASHEFVDLKDEKIEHMFKLYPWEWMMSDEFFHKIDNNLNVIEPMWKMIISNKAILPILWEKYRNHPNLLPAFYEEQKAKNLGSYVKKPILAREGANIVMFNDDGSILDAETKGTYGKEGYIYQKTALLPQYDNMFTLVGSWVVGDKACGIGIREDFSAITKNTSLFIPHYFID